MPVLTRNRDRAEQVKSQIATLERAIDDDRAAALQFRQMAATREELLDSLAEQEAAGTISRDEVDRQLAAADREASASIRNAEARERAAEVRARELAPLRREVAALTAQTRISEQLGRAYKLQAEQTTAARKAITEAVKASAKLIELRAAADAIWDDLHDELGDDDELVWPHTPSPLGLPLLKRTVDVAGNDTLNMTLGSGPTLFVTTSSGLVKRFMLGGGLAALFALLTED
jgi:hypothetical protein